MSRSKGQAAYYDTLMNLLQVSVNMPKTNMRHCSTINRAG